MPVLHHCHKLSLGPYFLVIVASIVAGSLRLNSAEDTLLTRDEALAARRFEVMHKRIEAAAVSSNEENFPAQFSAKPIFKYSDPARGYVSAAVWKLGEEGRPKALIASELDRNTYQRPCISYEFISLTETPFSVTSNDIRWSPKSTLFQFQPVPDAPAPEQTPRQRLIQLREITKRLASQEVVKNEQCELTLLPQPVLRYTPTKADRADGAIFFFTFGTNPEVVIMFESDGTKWSYAAGRMTGAESVVLKLDNKIVWTGAPLESGVNSPFTGSISPIEIPGIAADGSELKQ